LMSSKQYQLQLRRTVATLQRVKHPNIIQLLAVVESDEIV
jgi:hypothetical protein